MSKAWSQVCIGLGAACILLFAVSLGTGLVIWTIPTHISYLFLGMLFILEGVTSIRGIRDKKIIRGLRFSFAGVGIVFAVIGLVLLIRS
jgi:hypothetical protein